MRRWLVIFAALLVAAAALYVLATSGPPARTSEPEIDAASREKLLEVLREGDDS